MPAIRSVKDSTYKLVTATSILRFRETIAKEQVEMLSPASGNDLGKAGVWSRRMADAGDWLPEKADAVIGFRAPNYRPASN